MKSKKGLQKKASELEKGWERAARFYESPESLPVLKAGTPMDSIGRRKLLGPGAKKLIALRMPEEDIDSLKGIAKKHNRKYQQLIVCAVEHYLDHYYATALKRRTG